MAHTFDIRFLNPHGHWCTYRCTEVQNLVQFDYGQIIFACPDHFRKNLHTTPYSPSLHKNDNYGTHISVTYVEKAKSAVVTILTLAPHSSHKIEPLNFFNGRHTTSTKSSNTNEPWSPKGRKGALCFKRVEIGNHQDATHCMV